MIRSFQLSSNLLSSSHPQLMHRIENLRGSQDLRRRFWQKEGAPQARSIPNSPGPGWGRVINPKSASPWAASVVAYRPAACHSLRSDSTGQGLGKIGAAYDYNDEQEQLFFQVCRFCPKDFRPRRPDGRGVWIWNLKATGLVLYRMPDVLKADHVLVVEGAPVLVQTISGEAWCALVPFRLPQLPGGPTMAGWWYCVEAGTR